MKALCPLCKRKLIGQLCPVHGQVGTSRRVRFERTYGKIAGIGSVIDERTPVGNVKELTGTIYTVSSNTSADPTQVNLTSAHGMTGTFNVFIWGSNSVDSIDGPQVATYVDSDSFTVPVDCVGVGKMGGTAGSLFILPAGWTAVADSLHLIGSSVNGIYMKYTG